MHHLVIGEFVFAVGDRTPMSKLERNTPGAFTESALYDGARSEFTGQPLEKMDIPARWLRYGAAKSVNELRALISEPQQVSDGQGFNLGKWTLSNIKESRSEIVHDGRAMVTDVTLQLMEFREK